MDFIAVDFETATNATNSACAIGLAFVDDMEIIDSLYYLIQPPGNRYNSINIDIHGITPEMTKNEPDFLQIWKNITHYFDGRNIIIAHNSAFDMSVLKECLKLYELEMPDFYYACSISLSNPICSQSGTVPSSLVGRAEYFDIDVGKHHNAQDDAKTCASIVIESIVRSAAPSFIAYCERYHPRGGSFLKSFIDVKDLPTMPTGPSKAKSAAFAKVEKIDIKQLTPTRELTEDAPLTGKNIVITGEFEKYSRNELAQILVDAGATIKSSVSSKTHYLICGRQDIKLVGEDGLSGKQEKALALQEKGHPIRMLGEEDLDALLGGELSGESDVLGIIMDAIDERYKQLAEIQAEHLKSISDYYNITVKIKASPYHGMGSRAILARVYSGHFEMAKSMTKIQLPVSPSLDIAPIVNNELGMLYNFDPFGCCSRYNECSANKACTHPDYFFASGCGYRSHLETGRVFYGNNRNID